MLEALEHDVDGRAADAEANPAEPHEEACRAADAEASPAEPHEEACRAADASAWPAELQEEDVVATSCRNSGVLAALTERRDRLAGGIKALSKKAALS